MKIILCIFISLICSNIFARPPIFVDSYNEATQISKDLNMPILIIVSAEWCKYCKTLEKTIGDNLDVFDDMILLNIDFDINKNLVTQYKVKKLPTIIYGDKKIIGNITIEKLQKFIEK